MGYGSSVLAGADVRFITTCSLDFSWFVAAEGILRMFIHAYKGLSGGGSRLAFLAKE